MTSWKSHLLTGVLTIIAGCVAIMLWWNIERGHVPRLARVDIGRLVANQQKSLVERVKPGIDAQEQARIFEDAKVFGNRLDAALDQVSRECACALLNSAALLKAGDASIPDLTGRVEALTDTASPSTSRR